MWLKENKAKNLDFLEEIGQNEFMSSKHKKVCITLNHIKHCLILFYFF